MASALPEGVPPIAPFRDRMELPTTRDTSRSLKYGHANLLKADHVTVSVVTKARSHWLRKWTRDCHLQVRSELNGRLAHLVKLMGLETGWSFLSHPQMGDRLGGAVLVYWTPTTTCHLRPTRLIWTREKPAAIAKRCATRMALPGPTTLCGVDAWPAPVTTG
jgi:hypothetical protein